MNTKLNPINSFTVAAFAASVSIGVLAFTYEPNSYQSTPNPASQSTDSEYALQALTMSSNTQGQATINLDGFKVQVAFELEPFPDSYGVPGSEFTAVEVVDLHNVNVFDANGNPYKDFTDHIDHRYINLLIKGYIEKHQLVEAV
ncbi:hypothetical protein AMD27_06790 [Acinetobacter sp. TGL-Y2]|uniref:hypothetical protein n=1 Tax=Acinetobacter sp. TGL-Y2 TaxID=1407071 RepID=UPI0007A64DD1|nr:hypothetical protein [Acinetobacter sp. TGL-Y2]AMW78619.1 hypothetical protein AMD27_06790 [Acinetobacter sp. TGL-Y2]